jgi:hypothetical protein
LFARAGAAHLAVGGFCSAFLARAADDGASARVGPLLGRARSLSEVAAILGGPAGVLPRRSIDRRLAASRPDMPLVCLAP